MLRNSEADVIARNPLRLRVIFTPEFEEEHRFLSGELVKGATRGASGAKRRGRFNGSEYSQPTLRVRKPREARRLPQEEIAFRRFKREWKVKRGLEAA